MATYDKPHLTLAEQVELLASRGMAISDRSVAERCLSTVGYYRLSGYWYPYREIAGEPPARTDRFVAETSLGQVMALYDFDRRLKIRTLDALERIEVAMRFRTGYVLGRRGPYAHLDSKNFDGEFTRPRPGRQTKFEEWGAKLIEAQRRSKEDFVTHFNSKYGGRLPVWVATELLDFGGLSFLYEGMLRADRDEIAVELGVVDARGLGNGRALGNWLRVLNYVRNICAHHSRLWNRNLADQLATKHVRPIPELAHLAEPEASHQNARPFAAFCAVAFLLRRIATDDRFPADLRTLMATGLPAAHRSPWEMGFADGWERLSLWNV